MELKTYQKANELRKEIDHIKRNLDVLETIMYGEKQFPTTVQRNHHGGCLAVRIPDEEIPNILRSLESTLRGKIILLEQQFKEL